MIPLKKLRAGRLGVLRDDTGQTAVEWTLVLAAFGLPMIYVFAMLLSILAEHYRMVAFMESLPFP